LSMSFPAKRAGTCAYAQCKINNGRILIGDQIRWNRRQKGIAWHAMCYNLSRGYSSSYEPYQPPDTSFSQALDKKEPIKEPISVSIEDLDVPYAPAFGTIQQKQEQPQMNQTTPNNGDSFLARMAGELVPYLDQKLNGKMDADAVDAAIKKALDGAIIPKVNHIIIEDRVTQETKDIGLQHKLFPLLLQVAQCFNVDQTRINVWLSGPAGSGKTSAAKAIAKSLGLKFYMHGALDSSFQLLGFIDAGGNLVRTPFRDAFEHGGLCLLDEVDAYSPNASLSLNAALANQECSFPDGMVPRHKDFVCIAAANTYGLGGTSDYVGRNRMDAAFMDRFVRISWMYDEDLETATSGNPAWAKRVQSIRHKCKDKGLKVVVSPRATYYGASLLASGMPQSAVEEIVLKCAMTDDQWLSVK
jgi:cobaltochelatase CobS